jgi:hypothetical protein
VARHLAVGHRVGGLLQLQDLEVVALDLVRHDEERIERALGSAGLKKKINTFKSHFATEKLRGHCMCKEMWVFPVNKWVDPKRITRKNGGTRRRRGTRGPPS